MAGHLECPVCSERATPPISLCFNGHIICPRCRDRVQRCPTCRGEISPGRCLPLEWIAESLLSQCRYKSYGCPKYLSQRERTDHEKFCPCKPRPCPVLDPGCRWEGLHRDLLAHLAGGHPDLGGGCYPTLRMYLIGWHLTRRCTWVARMAWGQSQFLAQVIKEGKREGQHHILVYLLLRHLGSREDTRRYRVQISLGEEIRRPVFNDVPRWVGFKLAATLKHFECMTSPYGAVVGMLKSGALAVTMSVRPIGNRHAQEFGPPVEAGQIAEPEAPRRERPPHLRGETANDTARANLDEGDLWTLDEEPRGNPPEGFGVGEGALMGINLSAVIERAEMSQTMGVPADVLLPVGEPFPAEIRDRLRPRRGDGGHRPVTTGPEGAYLLGIGRDRGQPYPTGASEGEGQIGNTSGEDHSLQAPNHPRVEYYPG
ncbi:E3 ubiquitin-protein ligase SIAH1-like [Centruroides sculpturatus]|uniref:E3 ubiquitin-protein ligase SIAH1-like n=1 Tax=Centruroides sculpturatus TaxID=218467 RepID=UPI000C6EBFE6|nr:E3 ubiquitin-protein ligase SIAH1-like [Centruroides sculpturatus]